MSKQQQESKSNRAESIKPLVSAADVNEGNYPRARFDKSLAWTIKEVARDRAPTRESIWRHRVAFASEVATSAYFGVKANWEIYPDFVGDSGFDFQINDTRIEVKTVTSRDDLELRISQNKIESADYFVLTQCTNPDELVQLIGYVSQSDLNHFGHRFDGDLRIGTEYMYPFEPLFLPPERIRATQAP